MLFNVKGWAALRVSERQVKLGIGGKLMVLCLEVT
jgi:hypothetical protein